VGSWARSEGDPIGFLDRLVDFEKFGVPRGAGTDSPDGFDLSRMRALLGLMGNPERSLSVVHVVGTKGKGSTAQMVAGILHASGASVGLYTSPHLFHPRESIALFNDAPHWGPITEDAFRAAVHRNIPAIEEALRLTPGLTRFEALTAVALQAFAAERCDVAVLEAGLGAARDATNVYPKENLAVAVVTGIGAEHMDALGGSLAAVASAKAGAMGPRRPCVIAPQPHDEAMEVLLRHAEALECPVVRPSDVVNVELLGIGVDPTVPPGQGPPSLCFQDVAVTAAPRAPGPLPPGAPPPLLPADFATSPVRLRLVGRHQRVNAQTAVAAAAVALEQAGLVLSPAAVRAGLERAFVPCRVQVMAAVPSVNQVTVGGAGTGAGTAGCSHNRAHDREHGMSGCSHDHHRPDLARRVVEESDAEAPVIRAPDPVAVHVVLDGAHTPGSAAALSETVRGFFPDAPVAVVLAMAADKDAEGVCGALRAMAPMAVMFAGGLRVGGSDARAAAPGALVAAWQRAEVEARRRGQGRMVCREQLTASVKVGIHRAVTEVAALGGGVVVVTGSLHAAAEGMRSLIQAAEQGA